MYAAQQLYIVLQFLPEADAGIESHLLAAHPLLCQPGQPLAEKVADLPQYIVIVWLSLHGLRRSLHVHADIARFSLRNDLPHLR